MNFKIKKIIALAFGIITLLIAVTAFSQSNFTKKYPAPGRLVDVGGYKLHINESYSVKATHNSPESTCPTVILDAGFACFSLVWNLIQPEVATFTRVCSYDRAGLGWSEKSRSPRTSCNMVKELHTLLENAQIPKPYILVGHSFGGVIMQLYANTYPDEVFGLVLVDSSHQEIIKKSEEFNLQYYNLLPKMHATWHHFLNSCGFETISNFTGVRAIYMYSLTKNGIATIPSTIKKAFLSRLTSPSAIYVRAQEAHHIKESHQQLTDSKNCFSDKPLTVISRGKAIDETCDNPKMWPYLTKAHEEIWAPLQKDLVTKSTKGKQIIAEKSGHTIVWSEPELVVNAIREMVDEYK